MHECGHVSVPLPAYLVTKCADLDRDRSNCRACNSAARGCDTTGAEIEGSDIALRAAPGRAMRATIYRDDVSAWLPWARRQPRTIGAQTPSLPTKSSLSPV